MIEKNCIEYQEVEVFKALADESRLKIIRVLLEKDSYTEYLAEQLGLTTATVAHHMKKLEHAGMVYSTKIQHYVIYSINRELLNKPIGQLICAAIHYEDKKTYEEQVINNCFEHGKLKTIPSQLKKREIIISYIAQRFEKKKNYTEEELVSVIREIFDDYCTIKRDLIGMGFVENNNSSYVRKV